MPRQTQAEVSYKGVPEEYKLLVGKYLFQALNVEFEIKVQDGSLILREPKGGVFPLEFSEEQGIWEAQDKTRLVEFEYDEEGHVKGIKATHVTTLHKK
jgi:hypothetical protein